MNNDLKPINTIPNFKRFCMTIGELPTSYLETMTYYEMLVWFTEYMKNTIIPTINNNGLAVEELQNKYIELKSYVDNYFDNLDVQEEINNKLDAMSEDGSLTNLIKGYVDPIYQAYKEEINKAIEDIETNVNSTLNTQNEAIDVLEARMDTFTHLNEGSTTGDAELQDIRVGFNGITYDSAGNSVRNQSIQVNQNKTTLLPIEYKKKTITWTSGSRIGSNGNIYEDSNCQISNAIPVNGKYVLFDYNYSFGNLTYQYLFNFYGSDTINHENLLGRANPTNAIANTRCYGNLLAVAIPDGAKYIVCSATTINLTSLNIYDMSFNTDLIAQNTIDYDQIKSIKCYENVLSDTFEPGIIGTDGTITLSTTYKISDYCEVLPNTCYHRKNYNSQALIGYYDINKNWISRRGADNVEFFITPDNCKYIRYADTNANVINQVVGRFKVNENVPSDTSLSIDIKDSEYGKTLNKIYNKKVCILGDSIAYGIGATDRTTDSWVALLQKYTKSKITNLAITGASLQYRSGAESEAKSVYTLSTETDFTPYDYVIISAGTNDILANIGEPSDNISTTACGALNLIIQNILTSNPYCQILFFGPMFRNRFNQGDGHNSDDYDFNGKWVIDLADKLQETAEKNHIPNKNLYRTFELNKYNANILLSDGLHPNNLGYERLYEVINDFINISI